MSSRLEDALIFVKSMPQCVTRIKPLDNGEIACYSQGARQPLRILDSDGNEISSHDASEQFIAVTDGILFLSYVGGDSGHRIDFLDGDKTTEGERLKINGYVPRFLCNGDVPDSFRVVAKKPVKNGGSVKVYDFGRDRETGQISPRKIDSRAVHCTHEIRNAFVSQHNTSPDTFISMDNGDFYSVAPREANWKMECLGMVDGCDEYRGNLVLGSKARQFVRAFKLQRETRQPSKEPQWTHSAIGPVLSVLLPNEHTALVGTENFGGRLYAFDLESGEEKFRHDMSKNFGIWSMVYDRGTLYLGTGIGGKGRIYAVDYKALKID